VIASGSDHEPRLHAVLLADSAAQAADAVTAANRRLAPHQRIRSHSLWPEPDFPRTPTLKIKRAELSRRIVLERPTEVAARSPLLQFLAGQGAAVEPSARLGIELGLGSLDRVELHAFLERATGRALPESALREDTSIAELEELLGDVRPVQPTDWERGPHYPWWTLSRPVALLRRLAQWLLLFPLLRIWVRLEVTGLERLEPVEPPVIFAANHTSNMDAVVIARALPGRWRRRLAVTMMGEYAARASGWRRWHRRFWTVMAEGFMNCYPFPQDSGFGRALEHTGELVGRGYCPLVFPEGGRTLDGRLQRFREGIGLLARGTRLPIAPVAVSGLIDVLPKGANWPRRGRARVIFGEPIRFVDGDNSEIAEAIKSRIADLLNS
jgi:long-chain acyl-CoA synthetase